MLRNFLKQKPNIIIAPFLKGVCSEFDLLESEATMLVSLVNGLDIEGGWWQVSADGFLFEFKVENGMFILTRNDDTCVNPINQVDNNNGLLVWIIWSYTELRIIYLEKKGDQEFESATSTTPSFPPLELMKWARQQNLISREKYDSEEHFRQAIISCIQTIQKKIDESGGYTQFWNVSYGKGGVVESRSPKRETEIHPTINCLLSDQSLILSFEVIPEHKTGIGNLDFLFIGQLSNGNLAKICIEFKNAHSSDLVHGLTVQLPKYMRNVGATYGIYAVLDYHGEWFKNPKSLNAESKVWTELTKNKIEIKDPIQLNIREIILKLSKPQSASKK